MIHINTKLSVKARFTGLLLLFVFTTSISFSQATQPWRSDPFARSVVFVPSPVENNEVCKEIEFQIEIGNGGSAADPILPGQVEWQINFPYDVMIVGQPTNLPPQLRVKEFICDPLAGGGVGETRVLIEVVGNIPPNNPLLNQVGSFILRFPAWGIIPNVPGRQTTSQVVLVVGFLPFSGNLDPNNDNSNAPIEFRSRTCTPFRSVKDGNWNDVSLWETFTCITRNVATCTPIPGGWIPATSSPVQGTSNVLVRDDVALNVNYTVQNCPLILEEDNPERSSSLTINPQITLGFNGGPDGNAYFNSRPVVVKSTADGTGAIGRMLSNSQTSGDDNVTVERFLPDGPQRRWNLLTFGVVSNTASIRDAWAGGSRKRVSNSQNYFDGVPLGTPPAPWNPKPNNVPYDAETGGLPADYVPGDGTIITGHRHSDPAVATANGYDWWPELIIPKDARWWETPTNSFISKELRTTPSSIRPYLPASGTDFGPERGTGWLSNNTINTGFGGSGLVNMKLTNAYNNHQAFMLFTRGDRNVLENWFGATTLRPTGQIMKQSVSVPISAGSLNVVGNPFPAPIDFPSMYNANTGSIEPYFFFWNSRLPGSAGHGAWEAVYRVFVTQIDPVTEEEVTVTTWRRSANISNPPNFGPPSSLAGVNSARVINSSQGIMVQGTTAGGNLVLTEAMKTAIGNTTNFRPFDEQPTVNLGVLNTYLNFRSSTTEELRFVDAINILVGNGFKEDLSDKSDIQKINSHTGSLGLSVKRGETLLMVESYPIPTTEAVFPLFTPGLTKRAFSLTFGPEKLDAVGRQAFLRDKFLNTLTPISTTENSEYKFEGTEEEASLNESRFEIVFKQDNVLPVTFTDITARDIRGDVQVNWSIATEDKMSHYEVEHSVNGTEFGKATKVDAKNVSPASYGWLHVQPGVGDHYYRVRAINLEGRSLTTRIVKVNIGNMGNPEFKVFPTVVSKTRNVTVQMTAMEQGSYTLQVTDMSGRVISARTVEHAGGSSSLLLDLPVLSKGKYNVRLYGKSGNFVEAVLQD
jgi:hypothetical protein